MNPSSNPLPFPLNTPQKRLSQAVGLTAALMLGAQAAHAQESVVPDNAKPPENPSTKASDKKKAKQLDAVNVHANAIESASPKFTAPLLDTAMSVTVLPQSVMQETAATSLQDALRNVPGITFAAGEGGTPTGDLPSIRGFNSVGNMYVDGMRDIGVQSRDIFDLQQVEVVKGPESSIAGRSAGGGLINLVSKAPQTGNFLESTGSYGSAGQYRATLDGNVQFNENTAGRLNLLDAGGGVPGRDSAVRTDKKGIAGAVTFGLNQPTRLLLNYYYFVDKSTPDYGVPVDYSVTGQPLVETRGINAKNYYGLTDRDFRYAPVSSFQARLEHDFNDAWTLRSQVRLSDSQNNYVLTLPHQATDASYDLKPGDLLYRLPVGNADRTRGVITETDLLGHFDTGSIHHDVDIGFEASQEKERLAGDGSYLGYNVVSAGGAQGFSNDECGTPTELSDYDCTNLYSPNPHDPWQGSVTRNTNYAYFTTRNFAPYAFDTITLNPHWKINAGVRWDNYLTSARSPSDPQDVDASDHLSFTSYQAAIIYKPTEQGSIYLSTSSASIPEDEAFSGSGQDEAFPANPYQPSTTRLKPEITRALELGTKWNLFGNRLLLTADVFDERHRNTAIEVAPGVFDQVGETTSKGWEVSANGSITDDWNVIAGYAHVDAKIVRGGINDEVGQQVPNTPPNTFSLWSTYRVEPAITLGGGAYYRDKQVGYAGPPNESIDSYWRFDTMAKWQIDPRVSLQFNMQNIFNRFYYSKIFYWYALPAARRTYLATVDVKF